MESSSNVDYVACKIRKFHDDDAKDRHPKVATTNFRLQFRKGTEE